MIKPFLVAFYVSIIETWRNCRLSKDKRFSASRLEADIIRQLHAIEKGLCLEKPRLGFGMGKFEKLFGFIDEYIKLDNKNMFCLYMARDALKAYLDFHKEKNFANDDIVEIQNRLNGLTDYLEENNEQCGGYLTLKKEDMQYSVEQIEALFNTRHSIREFSGEEVTQEEIMKAVALAQRCPSACNRQCSRVYFVNKQKYMTEMKTDLQGVGGFADASYGFLLVTGNKSAYHLDERNQYLVSASIFAGYLSLALHTYSIASCIIQRSVSPSGQWDEFKSINNIPDDEQIILMMAIGKYKEETKVPVSKRFPIYSIYRELK